MKKTIFWLYLTMFLFNVCNLYAQTINNPYINTNEVNGHFSVSVWENGAWTNVGTMPFGRWFTEQTLLLPVNDDLKASGNNSLSLKKGEVKIQIAFDREREAHIDGVFIDNSAPISISGAEETPVLALQKIQKNDLDIIDVENRTITLTYNANSAGLLRVKARIEPETIGKDPFMYPTENTYKEVSQNSKFYTYQLNSNIGTISVNGELNDDNLGDAFFKEWNICGSGHPDAYTYGWVRNDNENLYVAIDFTSDNTMDGEKDYTAVFVKTSTGIKKFKVSVPESTWGKASFAYTDKVVYQHKVYEYKIPFSAIGETTSNLQMTFAAYGTAAPPAAVPVATAATTITPSTFYANWDLLAGVTYYQVLVATESTFTNIVAGYNNAQVGNVATLKVTGLTASTTYYYKVRAYVAGVWSDYSNVITVQTPSSPITINTASAIQYAIGSGSQVVDATIAVNNGIDYNTGYINLNITSANANEKIAINSNASPNTNGAISFVGSDVFVGTGTGTRKIGAISTTNNGLNGNSLRINLTSIDNGGFENGDLSGWTMVNDDVTMPGDAVPFGWKDFQTSISPIVKNEGSYALSMYIVRQCAPFGSVHGPSATSPAVQVTAGDIIAVDWKAIKGEDKYDVYAFIVEVSTGNKTEILYERGDEKDWTTTTFASPYTGAIQLQFICGSQDATGGQAVSATMYIDNIRVSSLSITDAMVQQILRQVTYSNTNIAHINTTRTLNIEVRNIDGSKGTKTRDINIIEPIAPGGVYSNLNTWFKGNAGVTDNAGTVTNWADQLNAHNATATTGPSLVNNAINFNPALNFNGTNQSMVVTGGIFGTSTYTDLNVFSVTTVGANQGFLFYETISGSRASAHLPFLDGNIYWDAGLFVSPNRLSAAWGGTIGNPYLWSLLASTTATANGNKQDIRRDGATIASDNDFNSFTGNNSDFYIGFGEGQYQNGKIAEMFFYTGVLTATEQSKIESYLALKYGVIKTGNYVLSNGTIVWDATANATYHNNVFGTAKDNKSGLHQPKSVSINASQILTIEKVGGITTDLTAFMVGDNNATATFDNAVSTYLTMNRIWKVSEVGSVGAVSFTVSNDAKYLLVSNSTNFSGATIHNLTAGTVSADLSNGQYFTFAKDAAMTPPGNALYLNGSQAATAVHQNMGVTDVTLEMWVKLPTGTINNNYLFGGYQAGPNVQFTAGTGVQNKINLYSAASGERISSTTFVNDNKWHHVAYVFQGTTMKIYLDGNMEASGNSGSINWNNWDWTIGGRFIGSYTDFTTGSFDEVRIWKVARSLSDIRGAMYNQLIPANESNLVAYYQFNQTSGAAVDLKGTANAVLYNSPVYEESYALVAPEPTAATSITSTGFTANWTVPATGAAALTGYYLDVATNNTFSSMVVTKQNVTGATSFAVTGLSAGTQYYYRVRAYKTATGDVGAWHYSNPMSVTTTSNPPSGLSFSPSAVIATNGVTNVSITPTVTGTVASYSISPALPTGVSINTTTGVVSGIPSVLSVLTNYTVTASNVSGSTTATFTLTVNAVAPSAMTYSPSSVIATMGVTNISATKTSSGGAVVSYSISPALPTGVSLNTTTGAITGIPSVLSTLTNYTITATNTGGSTTTTFTLTVNAVAPSAMVYNPSSVIATMGVTNVSAAKTSSGGAVVSYSISPALPAGVVLNTTTGAISGIASVLSPLVTYTVTATNTGGSTTATFTLTVNDVPPVAPVAAAATNIGMFSFTANWGSVSNATAYRLDVSTENTFTSGLLANYNNLNVNNVTTYSVTGLLSLTNYYFRVRAYNTGGSGVSSNVITLQTLRMETTWNGTSWSPAIPVPTANITIDGPYTVGVNDAGSLECNNVTVNPNRNFSVGAGKKFTVTGNIANNGTFTLKSDATTKPTGSLLVTGTQGGSGVYTAERYMAYVSPYNPTAHFVSMPLTSGTSSQFLPDQFFGYNQTSRTWVSYSGALTVGKGYHAKYLTSKMTYWSGNFFNSSATLATISKINASEFAGNPYPSALDWNAASGWTKTSIQPTIQYFIASIGRYATWNGTIGTNGGTRYIPSFQGFAVRASAANAVLAVNNAARVHNVQPYYKLATPSNTMKLHVENAQYSDEAVIAFNADATTADDVEFDAPKLFEDAAALPHLYTVSSDNHALTINTMPEANVIPLVFRAGENGNYTLSVNEMNFDNYSRIWLVDNKLGSTFDISSGSYKFNYTAGENENRFELRFGVSGVNPAFTSDVTYIYASMQSVYVNVNQPSTVTIHDMYGRTVYNESLKQVGLSCFKTHLLPGTYVVKVMSGNKLTTQKIVIQ